MINPYFSSYKNQKEAESLIQTIQKEIVRTNNGIWPSDRTLIFKTALALKNIGTEVSKETLEFYLAS